MIVLNLASERCVATDEILCSAFFQNAGVRGCFPDKRFIGSCVTQGLINFARVGTAVHCLPSMFPSFRSIDVVLQFYQTATM